MPTYQIISSAGVDMGSYETDSETAALDAMARLAVLGMSSLWIDDAIRVARAEGEREAAIQALQSCSMQLSIEQALIVCDLAGLPEGDA